MIKGIDISIYQKNVDYKKLKESGIEFAIIRCGFGKDAGQKDSMFETHYKGLKDNGIKVGVYHYSYCTSVENAVKEAENCLNYIEGKELELPVFYDLEEERTAKLGRVQVTQIAINFCEKIESMGYKAGVYANLNWFNNYIDTSKLSKYKIWLAQWHVKEPTANFHYDYWQYTNSLEVAGIKVDGNYCYDEIPNKISNETIELLAIKTINGAFGNGDERKLKLGSMYNEVQRLVNEILINNNIETIAQNVIKGIYGNGELRKDILGKLYEKVQKRVNQILSK